MKKYATIFFKVYFQIIQSQISEIVLSFQTKNKFSRHFPQLEGSLNDFLKGYNFEL